MRRRPCNPLQLLWAVGLLAFLSVTAASQLQRGIVVSGRVFLPDNRPGVNFMVTLNGQNGFSANAMTDERGGFQFRDVPRQMYSLNVVSPSEMQFAADPITVNTSGNGSSYIADVFLRHPMATPQRPEERAQVITVREAGQNIPKDARKAFDRAHKLREQKKFDAALIELDKAIALFPDYFQALTEKAMVHINNGDVATALNYFGKALDLFAEYEPALSGAGFCFVTLGQYERAVPLLEKAIMLDPSNSQDFLFLGIASLTLNRWQRAQEALEHALKLDANLASAHMFLAEALAGQNLYERAADELHIYLQLNGNTPNAQRLRQREALFRTQKPADTRRP